MDDFLIFDFVKLEERSIFSDPGNNRNKCTLCFNDSIFCGLRAPVARPKSVSFTCPVLSTRKFFGGISQSTCCQLHYRPYLRLKIAVYISKLVELIHCCEHFADIKPRVFLFQDPRVVEQCPEVTPRHVLHSKIDVLRILKGIQQTNQPRGLGCSQDIPLNENVSNLHHDREWSEH